MALDEAATLGWRSAIHSIIDEVAGKRGGRIFALAGDGFLGVRQSCRCRAQSAYAVQLDLEARETEPGFLQLRIGVHLADVVSEGDLLGDGVNVAARIALDPAPPLLVRPPPPPPLPPAVGRRRAGRAGLRVERSRGGRDRLDRPPSGGRLLQDPLARLLGLAPRGHSAARCRPLHLPPTVHPSPSPPHPSPPLPPPRADSRWMDFPPPPPRPLVGKGSPGLGRRAADGRRAYDRLLRGLYYPSPALDVRPGPRALFLARPCWRDERSRSGWRAPLGILRPRPCSRRRGAPWD